MMITKMMIMASSILFLSSKNSIIMICSLIIMVISSTAMMIKTMKMIWMSFMVLMLTVGGMMIIYIFIISMNSNEKMSLKMNKKTFIPLIIMLLLSFKTKSQSFLENSNHIINCNLNMPILLTMMSILVTMTLISKISMNPFNPSKSIK